MKNTSNPLNGDPHRVIMPGMWLWFWDVYAMPGVVRFSTPALETYYNCQQGKYGLVTLNQRYNNIPPPVIELVDLKDKYKRKPWPAIFQMYLWNTCKTY